MNRHQRRRADARNPVMASAFLRALAADLDKARDGLAGLADIVEEGRAAGRDVASQEVRLGELVAKVGTLSATLDATRRASGLDHAA